jgi:hypothetical protein
MSQPVTIQDLCQFDFTTLGWEIIVYLALHEGSYNARLPVKEEIF